LLKGAKGEVVTSAEEVDPVFHVYPNPTTDQKTLTVVINKPGMATLDLTDLMGKRLTNVFSEKVDATPFQKQFDISGYSEGVYLLKLRLDNRITYKKVVVAP
jgi:hypothetical protein